MTLTKKWPEFRSVHGDVFEYVMLTQVTVSMPSGNYLEIKQRLSIDEPWRAAGVVLLNPDNVRELLPILLEVGVEVLPRDELYAIVAKGLGEGFMSLLTAGQQAVLASKHTRVKNAVE